MNYRLIARVTVHAMALASATAVCSTVHAQSVPDLGTGPATISSVQATACTPPSPVTDRYDHCGWGVWSIETQRTAVIASLSEAANYLICREQVDATEPNGYPLSFEVDGAIVSGGSPAAALGQAPAACSLVSGKKIVLMGQTRPGKPVRGYFIRLGPKVFGNTVSWNVRRGDRVLLAQLPAKRLLRVCFGQYNPVTPAPQPYLREYRLWADGSYVSGTGGTPAVLNANSCTDVEGARVGVEPMWATNEPAAASGRLTF